MARQPSLTAAAFPTAQALESNNPWPNSAPPITKGFDTKHPRFRGTWNVIVGGEPWGKAVVKAQARIGHLIRDSDEQKTAFKITDGVFTAAGMTPAYFNAERSQAETPLLTWTLYEGSAQVGHTVWTKGDIGQAVRGQTGLQQGAPQRPLLESFDLQGVANYIKERDAKRVVVLCGAGLSSSAGVPNYRTCFFENSGLPYPEAMFQMAFFRKNAAPFNRLCAHLFEKCRDARPTLGHHFVRLLNRKRCLLRCYTENIDSLELLAGIPKDKLVATHGSIFEAHVVDSKPEVNVGIVEFTEALSHGHKGWEDLCIRRRGLVKPKILFHDDNFPKRVHDLCHKDLQQCDLLLVLGSSLSVEPFRNIISKCPPTVPRVVINPEPVATSDDMSLGFNTGSNWRDVFHDGACDAACHQLALALGWGSDLDSLLSYTGQSLLKSPAPRHAANTSGPSASNVSAATSRSIGARKRIRTKQPESIIVAMPAAAATKKRPSAAQPPSLYTRLGISQRALPQQVREAFVEKAKKAHPDKGGSVVLFQQIRAAYEVLANPVTRVEYDNELLSIQCNKKVIVQTGGIERCYRAATGSWYMAVVQWEGFQVRSPYTQSLQESLQWYMSLYELRMKAECRSRERRTSHIIFSHLAAEVKALAPKSLIVSYRSYVRVSGIRAYTPIINDIRQAMDFRRRQQGIVGGPGTNKRKTHLLQLLKVKCANEVVRRRKPDGTHVDAFLMDAAPPAKAIKNKRAAILMDATPPAKAMKKVLAASSSVVRKRPATLGAQLSRGVTRKRPASRMSSA